MPRVTVESGWTGRREPGARAALLLAAVLGACTPEPRPLPEVPAGPSPHTASAKGPELGWSYQGALGPDKWASLRPEWAGCAGPGQSPIDLPLDGIGTVTVEPTLAVSLDLPAATFTAQSNGHLVSLVGGQNLALTMDGHRSVIDRIELHVPAEHSLAGATFDAELVFFAKSAGDRPILLSLLYRAGVANPAFGPLLDQLPDLRASGDFSLARPVELAGFVPESAPVLSYEGSLGTPPCTPGVQRLVVARVGELSSDQLAKLRQALPRSARPTLDRAARPVTLRSLSPSSPVPSSSPPSNPSTTATPQKTP